MFSHRQLREAFHLLFLERLLKVSDPRFYILKGGVNLRFFFASPRYSEDLDLDVVAGSITTLRKNGYRILDDRAFRRTLESFGIAAVEVNDPARAKHTATTQRFKVRLITRTEEVLPTKVEFSRRGQQHDYATEVIDPALARPYRRLSYPCQHYTAHAAAAQKVLALANRAEVQARDAFDLYVLWLGGHISSPEDIRRAVPSSERARAAENLMGLDYSAYAGQVLDFLETEAVENYSGELRWNQIVEVVLGMLVHTAT
jgi:hypothetical protein